MSHWSSITMAAGCLWAPTLPAGSHSQVTSNWTLLSSATVAREDTSLRVTLAILLLSETVLTHQEEATSAAAPYITAIILLLGYIPHMVLRFQKMSFGRRQIQV